RVAGLSTAGIPAASLYAFNFGATAAALSAGSGGTGATAVATSASSSTGSTAVITPRASVKPHKHPTVNVTTAAAPAQSVSGAIHDTALAALQETLGYRRKRGKSSLLT